MRPAAGHVTRVLSLWLSLVLASPASAFVAPDEDVVVLMKRAQHELAGVRDLPAPEAARRYSTAAELYGRAAARMPEYEVNRVARDDLLGQAVSAYLAASALLVADPTPLRHARELTGKHLEALERVYGTAAAKLPEHRHARALDDDIRRRLRELGLPEEEPQPPAPEQPPPEPPPVEATKPADPPPIVVEPTKPIDTTSATTASDRRWKIGLGVSLGLAGASAAVALGTGLAVMRAPFQGALYRDVLQAATESYGPGTIGEDLCEGKDAPAVVEACATRDRTARAAVAMTVLTGMFAASAVVFGVLLARARGTRSAALRRHRAGLVIGPLGAGVAVVAGAQF